MLNNLQSTWNIIIVNLPRNSAKVNLLAYPKITFKGNFCRSYKAFYGNLT